MLVKTSIGTTTAVLSPACFPLPRQQVHYRGKSSIFVPIITAGFTAGKFPMSLSTWNLPAKTATLLIVHLKIKCSKCWLMGYLQQVQVGWRWANPKFSLIMGSSPCSQVGLIWAGPNPRIHQIFRWTLYRHVGRIRSDLQAHPTISSIMYRSVIIHSESLWSVAKWPKMTSGAEIKSANSHGPTRWSRSSLRLPFWLAGRFPSNSSSALWLTTW